MLSGSRMTALMYIVMFTLFYLKAIEPLNFKKALLFLCTPFSSPVGVTEIGVPFSLAVFGLIRFY